MTACTAMCRSSAHFWSEPLSTRTAGVLSSKVALAMVQRFHERRLLYRRNILRVKSVMQSERRVGANGRNIISLRLTTNALMAFHARPSVALGLWRFPCLFS